MFFLIKIKLILYLEEQWEKDLEAELQDYEVVNEGNDVNDADVDDLLDDLK